MIKIIFTISFTSCLILSGCYFISQKPEISIKKEFDGNEIAVLSFTRQGSFLPAGLEISAADKLSDVFFMVNNYKVIDRAKINMAQIRLKINNTMLLTSEQIKKLGNELNAKYLVLGKIENITNTDYLDTGNPKHLYVAFRIISTDSSDIVGVVNYDQEYDDGENLAGILNSMLTEIATKIKN